MAWTFDDQVNITPLGRRLLNRRKDAAAATDERSEPIDPVMDADDQQPASDCRQCNNLFEIAGAIAQFMEDHRNG